ncbi:PDR/VanB family oxidoreductase [Dactylosporangium sp. NBC_01737]|uniref:PDR/VanB family oxidoreductase n=1 Tax=Dactylosporangium sp. NBC_01737 TaxID=2975959 RepID=UPI002E131A71|nr:PDR/VanB family oxidoreductase [Dactylosporangium sp. NBC_01737]
MSGAVQRLRITQVTWEADAVLSPAPRRTVRRALAPWRPGAHIDLRLPSGQLRQYSLCGDPDDRTSYRIAVLREDHGRGGSREIHETALAGRILEVLGPRNHFELAAAPRYLFLAGGIGITPILTMARAAAAAGVPWTLWYGGRNRSAMAFTAELPTGAVHLRPQDTGGLLPLADIVAATAPDTVVYACGPAPMLDAAAAVCAAAGRELHLERFTGTAAPPPPGGEAFEVELRQSGMVLVVPPQRSLLDVVLHAVPDAAYSCQEGYCGSCETKVLAGVPDHRDTVLSDAERRRGEVMMICVGRARSPRLVLDL